MVQKDGGVGVECSAAPHSDLLYHSLTIWIANRTIYHGAVICFMLSGAQVSFRRSLYGNGVRSIMKLKCESLCLEKKKKERKKRSGYGTRSGVN